MPAYGRNNQSYCLDCCCSFHWSFIAVKRCFFIWHSRCSLYFSLFAKSNTMYPFKSINCFCCKRFSRSRIFFARVLSDDRAALLLIWLFDEFRHDDRHQILKLNGIGDIRSRFSLYSFNEENRVWHEHENANDRSLLVRLWMNKERNRKSDPTTSSSIIRPASYAMKRSPDKRWGDYYLAFFLNFITLFYISPCARIIGR